MLLCHCSCPDADTANRIARHLVEERLAACASVTPGLHSTYRWNGRIEEADEVLLVAKTRRDLFDALAARVAELHPYALPEVVAVEVAAGLPAYLQWVAAETAAAAEGP